MSQLLMAVFLVCWATEYTVVLCYIGLADAELSEQRVAMRVSQGGHDVLTEKIRARFARTLQNLAAAVRKLPHVLVFDNSDLTMPFEQVAAFDHGALVPADVNLPRWLSDVLA